MPSLPGAGVRRADGRRRVALPRAGRRPPTLVEGPTHYMLVMFNVLPSCENDYVYYFNKISQTIVLRFCTNVGAVVLLDYFWIISRQVSQKWALFGLAPFDFPDFREVNDTYEVLHIFVFNPGFGVNLRSSQKVDEFSDHFRI